MSNLYLVRHGQAGTRSAYDTLSDLGRTQASKLGEYFVEQGLRFAQAYSGSSQRQVRTGAEVRSAYLLRGVPFPEITVAECWNEFSLSDLYRDLAPQLCADDPEFREAQEAMHAELKKASDQPNAEIHRRWMPCDTTVVNAWVSGQYHGQSETWEEFRARVTSHRTSLANGDSGENIVIFTSAMPTAIWTGLALDIRDQRLMRLAGVLHNSSFCMLKLRTDDVLLHAFNAIPHLPQASLRTNR